MIAQNESAVHLFPAIGDGRIGDEPILGRIIMGKLRRRRPGIKADQAAAAAFDDVEDFGGGLVEAIGGGE
jgi:hypothetical protein